MFLLAQMFAVRVRNMKPFTFLEQFANFLGVNFVYNMHIWFDFFFMPIIQNLLHFYLYISTLIDLFIKK